MRSSQLPPAALPGNQDARLADAAARVGPPGDGSRFKDSRLGSQVLSDKKHMFSLVFPPVLPAVPAGGIPPPPPLPGVARIAELEEQNELLRARMTRDSENCEQRMVELESRCSEERRAESVRAKEMDETHRGLLASVASRKDAAPEAAPSYDQELLALQKRFNRDPPPARPNSHQLPPAYSDREFAALEVLMGSKHGRLFVDFAQVDRTDPSLGEAFGRGQARQHRMDARSEGADGLPPGAAADQRPLGGDLGPRVPRSLKERVERWRRARCAAEGPDGHDPEDPDAAARVRQTGLSPLEPARNTQK